VLLLMVSAVVMSAPSNSNKIGMKVAVSQGALTYMKDQMLPAAEAAALSASIPDMTEKTSVPVVGKVEVNIRNIKLNTLSIANSTISLNSGNLISVGITGLKLDISLGWHYRESRWPHVSDSGHGKAKTSRSSGHVSIAVGSDSTGRPTAKFASCQLDMSDLSISLSGGASWLYNAIISLFHGKIVSSLESSICKALTGDIQSQLDDLLRSIPVQQPVGDHLAIDYSLSDNNGIVITPEQFLIASSAGEFYPRNGQPGKAPGQPVVMPDHVVDKHFQIFASNFSAESLGYASVIAGVAEMVVTKDMAPAEAKDFFSTDFFSQYAPGIIDKFGSGKDVVLFLAVHQTPDVIFSQANGVDVKAGVEMTVRAKNSAGAFEDAFTLLLSCDVDAVAKVNGTIISGELTDVSATASLVQTHVGDVDVNGINDLVQFALSMALDTVNQMLAKGTPLPSMQGLDFVNPTILYRDGYIIIATDIKFSL